METHIAVAINTFNRKSSFYECYKSVTINTDTDNIFVVDDCSDENYFTSDYRFESRVGISNSKNMALQLCYESGADHIFLVDDDVRFLKKGWEIPYIESGEHHLCATFYKPIRTEGNLCVHALANGYCLYFSRHCIETVGGFDTKYNNKFEHVCLSRRIFNAGLTKHMFQDVVGSEELIYCLDKDNAIQRSFTHREMQDNLKAGYEYFNQQRNSSAFIEFRT